MSASMPRLGIRQILACFTTIAFFMTCTYYLITATSSRSRSDVSLLRRLSTNASTAGRPQNLTWPATWGPDGAPLALPSSGRGCAELFRAGEWVLDTSDAEPYYSADTCPILTSTQDCSGNGRPDRGYERWRWRPAGCGVLPRFDSSAFLRLMRGKTLAFVGDSVARNHMESLMCMLWQVEVPANKGNRRMQKWLFRSHKFTVVRIWSAWLVNITHETFEYAPENLTKLHLEVPDDNVMSFLSKIDVLVISSGHWFSKPSAYIVGNQLVGGQLWSHKRLPKSSLKNPDAFAIAMHTSLRAIVRHREYKGLTILRTYSPDHYEGGAWNTGGSCTGKTRPNTHKELVFNAYTDLMRRHQLEAYDEVVHHTSNVTSKTKLMDITFPFSFRADGHPGPYRNRDPKKITTRGPHGEPPPQDCLHWCMPGPVDTWNEFLLEMLRREFDTNS